MHNREHERQFAYEAHTACERHGSVLGVEITAGNVHDSVAWDAVYNDLKEKFSTIEAVAMDAGYKTPWITRTLCLDAKIPVLPYTRSHYSKDRLIFEYCKVSHQCALVGDYLLSG